MANNDKTAVFGIDVSRWNGGIDWSKVKAAGVKFAMLKFGYGSGSGEACGIAERFEENLKGALLAGVDVGCYFYSYAMSAAAAKKEGQWAAKTLEAYKGVFTYPVAFDLEDSSQTGLGKATLTEMALAFTKEIHAAGFYPMLYTNLNWLRNYLNTGKLGDLDIWLAQWAAAPTYGGDFGIWQNSATGKVSGITGDVDTNYAYRDYPKIIRAGGYNGMDGWNGAGDKIHDGIEDAVDHIVDAATGNAKPEGSGDVNGDGKVTAADARTALRAAVGLEELTEKQKEAADMNGDGEVTASDARKILRKAVGEEDA